MTHLNGKRSKCKEADMVFNCFSWLHYQFIDYIKLILYQAHNVCMTYLVTITLSGKDMLSLLRISVAFLWADLLRRRSRIVIKRSTTNAAGTPTPMNIGVLSWSRQEGNKELLCWTPQKAPHASWKKILEDDSNKTGNEVWITCLDWEWVMSICEFIWSSKCTNFNPVSWTRFQRAITIPRPSLVTVHWANGKVFNGWVLERVVGIHDLVGRPNAVGLHIFPAGHLQPRWILGIIFRYNNCIWGYHSIGIWEVILTKPDLYRGSTACHFCGD